MNNRKQLLALPFALLMLGAAACSAKQDTKDAEANEYTLIWHDEFDAEGETYPSTAAYEVPARSGATWSRFISDRKDLMEISDGVLHMYCRPNPVEERNEQNPGAMVSGAIQTKGHFSFKCGRVEARMRVEGFTGSFPAFWLMPENQPGGWPTAGEIDIFESINDEDVAYATIHTGFEANQDFNTPGYKEPTTIGDWHVYGVDWTPDSMKFTIDGKVYGTLTPETVIEKLWPFNESEFYIILNQSVGKEGGWAAAADTTHTYLTEVDWVRVYQRAGEASTGSSTSPSPIEK